MPQITREAPNRKVRQRVEFVEDDSEMFLELSLVISLKLSLRRR